MKNTPVLNSAASTIHDAIETLLTYSDYDDVPVMCLHPFEDLCELQLHNDKVNQINLEMIKAELVETLDNYGEIPTLIQIVEFKLKKLFQWKYTVMDDFRINQSSYQTEFNIYSEYQQSIYCVDIESHCYKPIKASYMTLATRITRLKKQIIDILDELAEIGRIYLRGNSLPEPAAPEPMRIEAPAAPASIRIASRKKSDVIKILSAMYDAKMFVDPDGKPLSNKQNMMEAFGQFLMADLSAYSTLLSQAKDKELQIFLKPFADLEKVAQQYFNED